jgi:hypothetical protein
MDKFDIEEIFAGEAVPEGTIDRMEKERQIAYIVNKLNVRMGKQKDELNHFVEELLRETLP